MTVVVFGSESEKIPAQVLFFASIVVQVNKDSMEIVKNRLNRPGPVNGADLMTILEDIIQGEREESLNPKGKV